MSMASPPKGTLDEVQAWMREQVWKCHEEGIQAAVMRAATGTGKTHTAADLIREGRERFGRPSLFLAHRKELLDQARDEFLDQGLDVLEEAGHKRAHRKIHTTGLFGGPDVIVASKDSLHRDRIIYYPRDYFGLVLTDECHLSDPESYRHIYKYFDHKYHVGLTATDFRMDGSLVFGGPDSVYQARACHYSLRDAIRNGHLAPIRSIEMGVGIDLTGIRMSGRKAQELDPQELERRVLAKLASVVNAIRQEINKYRFDSVLVFAPDVRSSYLIAEALGGLMPGLVCEAVCGDDDYRSDKIDRFKAGQVNVLVSCDLLTTGFNYPPTQAIFMAVATKSLVKFIQCVGRGTRLAAGKQWCYVFGYSWTGVEGLVSTVDMFLEDFDNPRLRERAREIAAGNPGMPPMEAAERAERDEEIEERKDTEAELDSILDAEAKGRRALVRKKEVEYVRSESTPFGQGDPSQVPPRGVEPASPAMVDWLRSRGVERPGALSQEQARRIRDEITTRDALGLATEPQARSLVKCGAWYHGAKITLEQARRLTKKEATSLLLKTWKKGPSRKVASA